MPRLTQRPKIELNVGLQLNAAEVQALDALAGYGADAFLEVFYKHMGKHYLQPHEAGLRSLFKTIRAELPAIIERHDAALTAFVLQDPVVMNRQELNERLKRAASQAQGGTKP